MNRRPCRGADTIISKMIVLYPTIRFNCNLWNNRDIGRARLPPSRGGPNYAYSGNLNISSARRTPLRPFHKFSRLTPSLPTVAIGAGGIQLERNRVSLRNWARDPPICPTPGSGLVELAPTDARRLRNRGGAEGCSDRRSSAGASVLRTAYWLRPRGFAKWQWHPAGRPDAKGGPLNSNPKA
jgi:hypothetical protein